MYIDTSSEKISAQVYFFFYDSNYKSFILNINFLVNDLTTCAIKKTKRKCVLWQLERKCSFELKLIVIRTSYLVTYTPKKNILSSNEQKK
jgi:hypothetical protein